ncbi:unnamed protein product [Rhizoctonia solani]|uniref:Uncharacterized protein n=1 Tax=Rhizoctonia solani TaxID=456999 RepID=A0A8H3D4D6_9AGAM|nr:unnamed protein product [Rhizoctonia solani]
MQNALSTSHSILDLHPIPFQFNVTLGSPLFDISPVSSDERFGWAPSCLTPNCLPSASWSTSLINSTLDFSYWGFGVTFDGTVEGDMTIQLTRNGQEEWWNPSEGTLFTIKNSFLDELNLQNVTLKVMDASPNARLTVTQARVNSSSRTHSQFDYDRWTLASDSPLLRYNGFTPSTAGPGSLARYVSTTAGDKVHMSWNGSTVLLYGPCGPSSGLVRVAIDGNERTLNLSRPFQSDDCLLFQSQDISSNIFHRLEVENIDGGLFLLDRMEFMRMSTFRPPGPISTLGEMAIIMLVVAALAAGVLVVYTAMTRKAAKKVFDDSLEPLLL